MVRILVTLFTVILLVGCGSMKTTTEGDEVEKVSISTVSDYNDSIKYAIQVLSMDLSRMYEMYPTLREKNVGLGFAESVRLYGRN